MSETSPNGECRPAARRPVRMCVRCNRVTDEPVVVSEAHAATGPGFNVYACPGCTVHYPSVPDVFDLLPTRRTLGGAE
ncbi:hypothetical protein [Streptomyces sp. NPDC002851]